MKYQIKSILSMAILATLILSACAQAAIPIPASPDAAYPGVPTPGEAYPQAGATQPSGVDPYPASTEPAGPGTNPDLPVSTTPGGDLIPEQGQPWAPKSDDFTKKRGNAFVEGAQVLTLESYPPQFRLDLSGNLPTPCNELRVVVNPPDDSLKIVVEVYSVVPPDMMCAQIIAPFEASIPLEGLSAGKYTVWVDGQQIGEIEVP